MKHPHKFPRKSAILKRFSVVFLLVVLWALAVAPLEAGSWKCGLTYNTSQFRALNQGQDRLLDYRSALQKHGGQVVVLHPGQTPKHLERLLSDLDALLLPGGVDVDPAFYGESPHPKLETVDRPLDSLQIFLIGHAQQRQLPTMGICRGLQVLNVTLGGTLFQDLPTQHPQAGSVTHRLRRDGVSQLCSHPVFILPGSGVHAALGAEVVETNSYHHQAIKDLGRNLHITGRTADGVPEIIESTGPWFVFAVQFHPEKMRATDPNADQYFTAFAQRAQTRAKRGYHPGGSRHRKN